MRGLEDRLERDPAIVFWGRFPSLRAWIDWSLWVAAEVWLVLLWSIGCGDASLLERDISHLDTFGFRVGWIASPCF